MEVVLGPRRAAIVNRLLSVAVVLALLAPLVAPLGGLDLWGWLPGHGHASAGAPVGPHTHAWDGDAASPEGLAFTAGDIAGGTALPVLSVVPLLVPLLVERASRSPAVSTAPQPHPSIEPPPPR